MILSHLASQKVQLFKMVGQGVVIHDSGAGKGFQAAVPD